MPQSQTECICDAQVIAADGVTVVFPITDSEKLFRFDGWSQITFLVTADVGAGVESVQFDAEVAIEEDGDWYVSYVHDLTAAAASKQIQAANVTIVADTQAALFALLDSVPFVRVNVTNNGASAATVTVWAVVV